MSDLHEAAEGGRAEEIQEALRRGCDVNMKDESFGGRWVRAPACSGVSFIY